MKVFVSGDTRDLKMVGIVKKLNQEPVIPKSYPEELLTDGLARENVENTDLALFFLPSEIIVGIRDIKTASVKKIPMKVYAWLEYKDKFEDRELKKPGISQNILDWADIEFVPSFAEIEEDARELISQVRINKESESNPSKERR
ncbi:hypothetical protein IID22_02210 [Patescibacteria group bacterium]|nr:hypothetical protein [Patescibacteria group bacterium]